MRVRIFLLAYLARGLRILRLHLFILKKNQIWFNQIFSKKVIAGILKGIPQELRNRNVSYFLTDDSDAAKLRRLELNKYLEVAFFHGAFDQDLRSRLYSRNWEQFIQAVNELQVGYFFEQIGGFKIRFKPIGSGKTIGDFSIAKTNIKPIFVEVKSPYREAIEGINYGNDAKPIRQNLKKAYKQLPNDKTPTLVVLSAELRASISDALFSGILEALYGEPYFSIPIHMNGTGIAGRISRKRKPNGFFQTNQNTKLSAVATLEDKITDEVLNSLFKNYISDEEKPVDLHGNKNNLKYHFKVYHNPYAATPISKSVFGKWEQYAKSEDGTRMEWYKPDPATTVNSSPS